MLISQEIAFCMLKALKLLLKSHDETCAGPECGLMGVDLARWAVKQAERKDVAGA